MRIGIHMGHPSQRGSPVVIDSGTKRIATHMQVEADLDGAIAHVNAYRHVVETVTIARPCL